MFRAFVSGIVCTALVLQPVAVLAQSADNSNATPDQVIAAVDQASTQGFFRDREQFSAFRDLITSIDMDSIDSESQAGKTEKLKEQINVLRNQLPERIGTLIQRAKDLEKDGIVEFQSANWKELKRECSEFVGDDENTPLSKLVGGLEDLKNGAPVDLELLSSDMAAAARDCTKTVDLILFDVIDAHQKLTAQLEVLVDRIEAKTEECEKLEGDERKLCEEENEELKDRFKEIKEKQTRTEEVVDESKRTNAILGVLLIIAGIAMAYAGTVTGNPKLVKAGAVTLAAGGQMLEDNQNYETSKKVDSYVSKGRERDLDDGKGDVPDGNRDAVAKKLAEDGFKPMPSIDEPGGSIPYEIFFKPGQIKVVLLKSKRTVAYIKDGKNITVLSNNRGIKKLEDLTGLKSEREPFQKNNAVKLSLSGMGPDGAPIKIVLSERDLSGSYNLIVELP